MPEIFSAKTPTTKSSKKKASSSSSNSAKNDGEESRQHRHVDEYSQVMREERPSTNALAAYCPKPVNARFESQGEAEHIILLLRRHPVTNVPWMVLTIVLAVAPVLLKFVPFFTLFPSQFYMITILGWYMLVFAYALEKFLSWFFNVMIITDERIVDIDFENLIYKRISSGKIDNVEDVTSATGGFLRSLLNFGTVTVQTAATEQEFEFIDIPHPDRVVTLMNELILEEEREVLEGRVS